MPPAHFQRLLETALAHHVNGRLAEAEKLYRQARTAQPNNFDALHLSGALAYQQKRYTDAFDLLTRALRQDPRSSACAMRLGLACAALGNNPVAEAHLRNALRTEPTNLDAWSGLAAVLRQLGKIEEAIAAYQKVAALNPKAAEPHGIIGGLLNETKGPAAAIPHFLRALEIDPTYAVGWCNLGIAQLAEQNFAHALESLDRALKEDPTLIQAQVARALVFQQTYQLDKALIAFDSVLARQPTHNEARSGKLLTLNYLSGQDPAAIFAEHLVFGKYAEQDVPVVSFPPSHEPVRRLRIGFVSPDLRAHSIAYFLEPLLRHLDPTQFEIFLYHDHARVDAVSDRLRGLAKSWKNLVGQLNPAVEQTLRADRLDVAIDLAGHTGLNRLLVFARRVAPVQIGYLGYPNTSGLTAMDFRFTDAISDPEGTEEEARFYTEQRVRFSPCAWSYLPAANAPEPARKGNPEITFGSFNNPAKISRQTLNLWSRVLTCVPGSRLVLKGHGMTESIARTVMENKLQEAGLDLNRVDLLGRTPQLTSHLELYHRVDVALDPFPYHGTTTTCEALWMGLPVVSLRGTNHAARVGASLLTAVGHPEWIAENENQYVEIAAELARDPARREQIRSSLRAEMSQSALMDHPAQAKRFGQALRACWRKYCSGERGSIAAEELRTIES